MARFLLHHRHEPRECGVVFAAFRGHDSPLRPTAVASCGSGDHAIWWTVEPARPRRRPSGSCRSSSPHAPR